MRDQVLENLRKRFGMFDDLIARISAELLGMNLGVPKSKTLRDHLWCIVGGRESYAQAIAHGTWQGFANSMTDFSHESFVNALKASREAFEAAITAAQTWDSSRDKLLLELLEHECMHEGQIIRLMYGLKEEIPDSFRWA